MTLFQRYQQLALNTALIGLEPPTAVPDHFCTPKGARTIGCEGSIQYCFIRGYGETVFAVNPESCADRYVYPLAESFRDFLRLILACGSTTAAEQIVLWQRAEFERFLHGPDNAMVPGQTEVLEQLRTQLRLTPMEDPFGYVKEVQARFDDSKLRFRDEYYDILGLARPDGSQADGPLFEFEQVAFIVVKHKH